MNAGEVISRFKREHRPIVLPDGTELAATPRARQSAIGYAQFGRRFGGEVHYEIWNNDDTLSVLLDDERPGGHFQDPLRVKLAELAKAHGLRIPEDIGETWFHINLGKDVNCEGKTFEQIAGELGERFSELYKIFNETLDKFEKGEIPNDIKIDEDAQLDAADFVNYLAVTQKPIVSMDGREGVELQVYTHWPRHIRYSTEEMRLCFDGSVYYEIYSWHKDAYVELHDARGRNDELRKAIGRIVALHPSFYKYMQDGVLKIEFNTEVLNAQREENKALGCFKNAFDIVMSRVADMIAIFNPFFHDMCTAWENGGEKAMQAAAKNYEVNADVLTAAEAINRMIDDRIELDVGDGEKLAPDQRDGNSKRFSYQIYKNYHNGNVHFEVVVRGNELSVELHDERRTAGGKLRRAIRRIAERHDGLIVEANWFCVRLRHGVSAGRGMADIAADVERDAALLWELYGNLLSCFAEKGESALQNADSIELPPMAERPKIMGVGSPADVRPRESTFSWVSTVEDLFAHKPFSPDGSRESFVPGDYVIPVYQRKYTWTEENVSTLCRDLLKAAAENKPSYHLGTIIIHADRESGGFFVVDGQQRLRTISRILSQKIFREMAETTPGRKFTRDDEVRIWRTFMRFGEEDRKVILGMLRMCTVVCIAVGDVSEAFQLFSTQNGRGKPLSPENLLKAFHFHELGRLSVPADVDDAEEYIDSKKDEIDKCWETLNASRLAGEDQNLLGQVVGEHLYRIRCWLHGIFPDRSFSAKDVSAFKGLTLGKDADGKLPIRNLAAMRIHQDGVSANELAVRSIGDQMKPFNFIDQPIANGADFFEYVQSCCQAYKNLFVLGPSKDLIEFRKKYRRYCLYVRSGRRGDTYARHVFQSLCMYCYDRFGADTATKCFNELFCCAYYERAVNARCYYQTCGREFAVRAVQAMAGASTFAALKDRLCELSFDARDRFDASGADGVDGLEMVYEIFDGGVENV